MGLVHALFKPIPGRFKDFIAMAKANNYQSLHTTVIGPEGERIEVQIRTHKMHEVAERGIAAHWRYKESGDDSEQGYNAAALDKFDWLRELVSLHQQTHDADEFLENVKVDLADTEIYVFTPQGDVKEFPYGATPIDFAYSIHTDVGARLVAARVNGKMVPLRHQLANGDTIEVLTSKNQVPSKDWCNYCVTTRAKSKIRAFVRAEERKRAAELGREMLEGAFRKSELKIQEALSSAAFEKLLKDNGCGTEGDLFALVGFGRLLPQTVIGSLLPEEPVADSKSSKAKTFLQKTLGAESKKKKKKTPSSLITVDGIEDVLVHFAKCCNPIPGDSVVGFITLGRGITVHQANCEKTFEMDLDRRVDVNWSEASGNAVRLVRIRVVSHDIHGLLQSMTEVISSRGVSIHNGKIETGDQKAACTFDVSVKNTEELNGLMNALQKLSGVLAVTRLAVTQQQVAKSYN